MSSSRFVFENTGRMNEESSDLVKENHFLRSQIDMLKAENKKILEIHCKEKEKLKNNLLEVQNRLVKERTMFKQDIFDLNLQLEALKESLNKMLEFRNRSEANIIHECVEDL